MKGLLKKDMFIIMEQKALGVILIICCILGVVIERENQSFSPGFIDGYVTVVSAMTVITTISYDENENGMAYIMSMPVSRKMYTDSKYLMALIVSAGTGVLVTIINFIMTVAGHREFLPEKLMFISFCVIAVSVIINSIGIPSYLKYGVKKGAGVMILAVVAISAACFVLVKILEITGINPVDVINYMENSDAAGLSGLVITVAAICLIISYGISQKIMRVKEF